MSEQANLESAIPKNIEENIEAVVSDTATPPNASAWPKYEAEEIAAALAVLESGRVNQWTGNEVNAFGEEFAAYCNVAHALPVANGTLAIELALRALDITEGDEVVVTSRSFFASASAVSMVGATPVFSDVDLDSQNITASHIEAVITEKTKAIVCVHLAGWPCDMEPIMALARKHNIKVVEDCAQAHGATYNGQPVGSIGDIGAFSFCQDKIMSTAGEGGMVTTNSDELAAWCWSFKDHGKTIAARVPTPGNGQFRWLHEKIGTNWRLTELQAAIGRAQLRKLPDWSEQRNRNARRLTKYLEPLDSVRTPIPSDDLRHAYYKYYVFVKPEYLASGWTRDRIVTELIKRGVATGVGSCPDIGHEIAFRESVSAKNLRPNAQALGQTSMIFQVDHTLNDDDIDKIGTIINDVVYSASSRK